jgi:aldose sugar dehydrogenase
MTPTVRLLMLAAAIASTTACADGARDGGEDAAGTPPPADAATAAPPAAAPPADATPGVRAGNPFIATEFHDFDAPWAMTFLPDGRLLVTEKAGTLHLFDPASRRVGEIRGVPEVVERGQGGFGDVVLHPEFATNRLVYVSYVEAGEGGTGAAVARGALALDAAGGGALEDVEVIWRQVPKLGGDGHFGHRLAFGPDGKLYVSNGDRQQFDPAQDMSGTLGKIVRLNDDGTPADGNPFADQGGIAAQVWTLGHRNPLGLAFDGDGRLWAHEMGPAGGDELNRIERGSNYGYPIVSDGDHYDGKDIPDHATRPEFNAPEVTWTPVIAPAGLVFYDGTLFPDWQGDAFIGGLASKALVRIDFDGDTAREAERYDMGQRIREVEQGPDGALWLLEDGGNTGGRLLKLTPAASSPAG